jgi:hypothetical protein
MTMTEVRDSEVSTVRRSGKGVLFGVPVGDLGWFASLLMGTAAGFAAFFATTFVSIISLLIFNTVSGRAIDYAYTYKRVGLPVGLVVLGVAYGYLARLWITRQVRRG